MVQDIIDQVDQMEFGCKFITTIQGPVISKKLPINMWKEPSKKGNSLLKQMLQDNFRFLPSCGVLKDPVLARRYIVLCAGLDYRL